MQPTEKQTSPATMTAANQPVRVEAFGTEGGKTIGPGETLTFRNGAYVWVGKDLVALLTTSTKASAYIPERMGRKSSGWGKE